MRDDDRPPILAGKRYDLPSAFTPESLLREARRQKAAPIQPVPDICLLDPDGDIVRRLQAEGRAQRQDGWVCYHTDLHVFDLPERERPDREQRGPRPPPPRPAAVPRAPPIAS